MDTTTAAILPILQYTESIVETVRRNRVTVIIAETGSGKTTQIPQMLEDAGLAGTGMIGVTQPRRVVRFSFSCLTKLTEQCTLPLERGCFHLAKNQE
jgi:HrpA-like RNA helicase